MRSWTWRAGTAMAALALTLGACSAVTGPEVTAEQRAWCLAHEVPELPGGVSVATAARELAIASPEVTLALEALEATLAEGGPLAEALVVAQMKNDAGAAAEARAAYEAWQAEAAAPAAERAKAVLDGWSATPAWAEACGTAWLRRAAAGATPEPPATAQPPASPTPEATPTAVPEPTPRIAVGKTLDYTSATSAGRLIELTFKATTVGTLRAGKLSAQVEGVGYTLAARTPVVGCVPDCRVASGAERISYLEWTAPAPGKGRNYTIQLKAQRAGTYEIALRTYRGPAGDPIAELVSWTVEVRVR